MKKTNIEIKKLNINFIINIFFMFNFILIIEEI